MLDQDIKDQLKTALSVIENKITLVYQPSTHSDQAQLLELLNGLAETSDKISVEPAEGKLPIEISPQFTIFYKGRPTNIFFNGIPGGHEFTSLVVALLNTDGKGKLPEPVLIQRIKKIKGPVKLKTYISLSCENCPDVVQALNQMALLNPKITHEMVDGQYTQDEISKLGIQGVPSVIHEDKLIHSGRITFLDLLAKLESAFGIDENVKADLSPESLDLGEFDVVVVGGGPAGAAAAIYSVRKGLKTALVAEKFGGQVQDTRGIENLISVIYTEGPELSNQLSKHVESYPVKKFEHRRVKNIVQDKSDKGIDTIHLEGGEFLKSKATIITTGAKWRELNVPGEKEYIGKGVAFCPHCDGPFYKGKSVAVVGGGNSGVEAAIDLAGLVKEVTLFEYNDSLKADQVLVDKLKSLPNTKIITNAQTKMIHGDGQKVTGLEYLDRKTEKPNTLSFDGIFVQIGLLPNSGFVKDFIETNPFGEIIVDNKGRTSAKRIYAAGDVTTTPFKQIIIAMGEGAKVALAAFEDRMYGH